MSPPTYDVSGLKLRSDLALPAPAAANGKVDFDVRRGEPVDAPWVRPTAAVIAEHFDVRGWPLYSFCRRDDGATHARFYGLADFTIHTEQSQVECHTHPDVDEGLTSILVAGSLTAYLLSIAGECVLHASAVELLPGRGVAFVGPSARGKTTTAALLCASGLPLLADDVLPVRVDDGDVRCHAGPNELRLRPKQVGLIERFETPPGLRVTVDERTAVQPAAERTLEPLLSAVVVPLPSRDDHQVRIRKLRPGEAVQLLVDTTRIEGWREPERLAQVFGQAADLATRVPIVEATIPWGPPFAEGLADDLIRELQDIVG